ncbi:MAG: hemerythrin [Gemmatimonadales bacterium]|nr:MAG: hemerythrin [Gemmatimonadales bacterium]
MATLEDDRGRDTPLHHDLTLNEIVTRQPEAAGILLELGFDACCGGARTLLEASRRCGVDPEVVLRRLSGPEDR